MSLALGFLHPALLWALPLAAIPIIVHLLNRRRFQRVRWAAMEFLLAAMRRNRRRVQMEHWLVLLLRTLAVVALVLLVARPRVEGSLLGEDRVHHVVVLDDSASLAQRHGAGSVFDEERAAVQRLAQQLARDRPADAFSLIRTSAPDRPDLAAMRMGSTFLPRLRGVLDGATVQDGIADLAGALRQARRRVDEAGASAFEVQVFSDLRAVDWLAPDGSLRADVGTALRELQGARRVALVDVAGKDVENVGVVGMHIDARVPAVAVPCDVVVEVQNRGAEPVSDVAVALEVDGRSRVVQTVPTLAAGESHAVTFPHTFRDPGFHGLVASLAPDRFAPDDRRAAAVDVVKASQALLVDGEPSTALAGGETDLLAAALQHPESGIEITRVLDHALADEDLEHYDVVWLCNVAAPPTEVVDRLEHYVAAGGGLVVFLGDQVDSTRYAATLARDEGLLPAVPGKVAGDLDRPSSVALVAPADPVFRVASDVLATWFERWVQVGRWFSLEPSKVDTNVLLRVGSSDGPPLMVERVFGKGRVVLVTTTADLQWTSWAKTPAWLIVTQRLQQTCARARDQSGYQLGVDSVLQIALDPARYRADAVVRSVADDAVERTFTAQPATAGDDVPASVLRVPMAQLDHTGLYTLQLTTNTGETETRLFARNASEAEGRLAQVPASEWRRLTPADVPLELVARGDGSEAAAVAGGESWRVLAFLLLGVLLAESILAWRFGRR